MIPPRVLPEPLPDRIAGLRLNQKRGVAPRDAGWSDPGRPAHFPEPAPERLKAWVFWSLWWTLFLGWMLLA